MSGVPDGPVRDRILDAAIELIGERGVDRVSLAAVAARAGVSPPTVVRHAGTRDELLVAAVDLDVSRVFTDLIGEIATLDLAHHDAWPQVWTALVAIVARHPVTRNVLDRPSATVSPRLADLPAVRALMAGTTVLIDSAQRAGLARTGVDPSAAADGLATILAAVFLAHVQLGIGEEPARLEAILAVVRAILAPPPPSPAPSPSPSPEGPRTVVTTPGGAPAPERLDPAGPKGAATRRRILDAAVPLFGANGYRSTSVAQVAREVGLAPAAVFAHFGSKEVLFREAFDHDALALLARVEQDLAGVDVTGRWPRVVALMWATLAEHPMLQRSLRGREREMAPTLLTSPAIRLGIDGLSQRIADGQAAGTVRNDLAPGAAAEGLVEVALCLLMAWSQGGLVHVEGPDAPWAVALGAVLA